MLARLMIAIIAVSVSACSINADPYSFSPETVSTLRDAPAPVRLGEFSNSAGSEGLSVSLRGSSMVSPYGTFPAYVKEALRQELAEAQKLSADAPAELSGALLKNKVDVSGIVTGEGLVEARFVVTRGGVARYDKVVSADGTWPSSFLGSVAIPRGLTEYRNLVRALVRKLVQDPDFMNALR